MAVTQLVHVLSGDLNGAVFSDYFDTAFEILIKNGGGVMETALFHDGIVKMEVATVFEFGIFLVVVVKKSLVVNVYGSKKPKEQIYEMRKLGVKGSAVLG
jgi:hypothetical protein